MLAPDAITQLKRGEVDQKVAGKVSAMPEGMANVPTKEELLSLLCYLEVGGVKLHGDAGHGHGR
ncbi:MAG: hypothetical protein ACK5Q5_08095 [Planctomycetaceae bacterium]